MSQDREWAEKKSKEVLKSVNAGYEPDPFVGEGYGYFDDATNSITDALLEAIRRERTRCADICSLKAVECEREAMPDGEFAALDCAKAILSPDEGAKPCTCNELPDYDMKCEACK